MIINQKIGRVSLSELNERTGMVFRQKAKRASELASEAAFGAAERKRKFDHPILKIAIIGFGREGKSLADFLYKHCKIKNIIICDRNPTLETSFQYGVSPDIKKAYPNFEFHLGKNYLKDIEKSSIIYLSPGVSPHIKTIEKAKKNGGKISSATELFFNLCPAKIIGITGTKGKGTVATILYKMLKASGKKVHLLGNIGKPAIEALPKIKKNDLVIMELSSFQLQNLKKSPYIAIVLKITADHLDYHKTLKEYFAAKTNILRHQKIGDIAIVHQGNKNIKILKNLGKGKKILFNFESAESFIFKNINFKKITVPGRHNLENIIAAAIAAKILKIKDKNIQKIINNFRGREHRLEFVKNINGVKYYNDSAATNPDATIAAISSFESPIILISGGQSKNIGFKNLGTEILKSSVKKVILFGENKKEMASQIYANMPQDSKTQSKLKKQDIILANNLKQAIKIIERYTIKGNIILFSPASASFDQFKNYEERGLSFKKEL